MKTKASKISEALRHHPLLAGVPAALAQDLLEGGEVETHDPGAVILREGDEPRFFWFLCAGSARVFYASPDGFQVTVKIFSAPAAWGELEVVADHPHIENVSAVDRATALRITRAQFQRALSEYPAFLRNLFTDTCARFLIAAQHERALAFLSVEQRLANLLLAYVRMYGVPVEEGTAIRIPLSHQELAQGLAVAKKSVTRTLNAWKRAGVLSKTGTRYVVHDLAALEARSSKELLGIDWTAGAPLRASKGTRPRRGV